MARATPAPTTSLSRIDRWPRCIVTRERFQFASRYSGACAIASQMFETRLVQLAGRREHDPLKGKTRDTAGRPTVQGRDPHSLLASEPSGKPSTGRLRCL